MIPSDQRPQTSLLVPMETWHDQANEIAAKHRAEAERAARDEPRTGERRSLVMRVRRLLGR